jgi:formate hydrogenlyase subunit 3/multisubunit Na+/H+ antiporter MnhD subunit
MSKRPLSVTIIGCLFLAAGAIGLAYHATELDVRRPLENDAVWVCFLRLVAIVCGVFLLRGANWARWLLLAWFAYHVALSALHSPFELAVHGALFVVIAYLLFRPEASVYFRGTRGSPPADTGPERLA